MYEEMKSCIICNASLEQVFDLGEQYVVDFVSKPDDHLLKAPLVLMKCSNCHLIQLKHRVSPDRLYKKFWYRSGINESMKDELLRIVEHASRTVTLKPGDKVLDIGANDGTLLGWYDKSITTIGIDPCKELIEEGMKHKRIDFGISDYFSLETIGRMHKALAVPLPRFKIITAISMFYDVDTPVQFLQDCKSVLHPEGVLVIQMNYLPSMLKYTAIDNVCHEHLAYYSLLALREAVQRAGLEMQGAEESTCNGGSVRAYITHPSFNTFATEDHGNKLWLNSKLTMMLVSEMRAGLDGMPAYHAFKARVDTVLDRIRTILSQYKDKKVYAYGASTRGTVLTQLLFPGNADNDVLAVADRDENKIGKYMVGTWWKIVTEKEFREKANTALVLPWHFHESIVKREAEWINRKGGKMIFPLPEPYVMESILDTDQAVAVKRS